MNVARMRIRTFVYLFPLVSLVACQARTLDAGSTGDGGGGGGGTAGGGGVSAGPVKIASGLAEAPHWMASDGTTLFLIDGTTGFVETMPVEGGPITMLASTSSVATGPLLYVDATNVYVLQNVSSSSEYSQNGLSAIPKSGGAPRMISDGRADVEAAAFVGATAYWVEDSDQGPADGGMAAGAPLRSVKSAPISGGSSVLVAQFETNTYFSSIAVTASTIFLQGEPNRMMLFPLSAGPMDGGLPQTLLGVACSPLLATASTAYCAGQGIGAAIAEIGSDGTLSPLVPLTYDLGGAVLDATYLYWLDAPATGAVLQRVPLQGGPVETILAGGGTPAAIDDAALYWSDAPDIWRLAK